MPSHPGIEARLFRANPAFELVVWDRLDDDERRVLRELATRESFYGILRPRAGSARAVQAVDRDTALLLLTLPEAAPLPAFAQSAGEASVAELVTDGVLEVWDGDRFLTGGVGAALLGDAPLTPESQHRLGRLSAAAMRYGAALRLRELQALAAHSRLQPNPTLDRQPAADAADVLRLSPWSELAAGGSAAGWRPDPVVALFQSREAAHPQAVPESAARGAARHLAPHCRC
jgi:hypothetical protein